MPPYGRGGAGNIQAMSKEPARVDADLEANQAAAGGINHTNLPADYVERQKQQQQYARIGRGGAGNFYDTSAEAAPTGSRSPLGTGAPSTTVPIPTASSTTHAPSVSAPDFRPPSASAPGVSSYLTPGRGGAGNYSFGAQESEERATKRRTEEEKGREELKKRIEEGVTESLAMPAKAKVAGGEPW